jgi:MFS family permease
VATVTGVLVAGRRLVSMAFAPLAGTASDWLGSRWKVVAWSLAIGAVGVALLASDGPVAVLVGIALEAIATSSLQALVIALAGDLAGQEQQGRSIGLVHTVGDLGSAAGPLLAYALLPGIGLPGVYVLCAGLFVAGLALVWQVRRTS